MRGWQETTESPAPQAWEPWNLKSSVVPTRITLTQKFREAPCWHFNSLSCCRGMELQRHGTLNPMSPIPWPRHSEGNSYSALLLTKLSTSCRLSGLGQLCAPHLTPVGIKSAQKGCLKSWSSSNTSNYFWPFFFNSKNWKINSKFSFSL